MGCTALVVAPSGVYGRVRDTPALFLVLAGHQGGETVVEDQGDYLIVRATA